MSQKKGIGSLLEGHRTAMTFTCKDDGLMRASFELWSWEWLNGPPPSFHAKSRADEGGCACAVPKVFCGTLRLWMAAIYDSLKGL
ncbi:hypothetical protein EAH_00001840 [Eimeria acervulina]|uniref:Uncharacterized protein n=1 Tax=Eimeria acervulina TaxID=5801 RepID=U6GJ15_EIMAC|nr:hypothetical protein EAH_00001840 [Eimeria acervulina]CDI79537.1 hypothetical protein EAH_00001840 [Eimeria acervulina]